MAVFLIKPHFYSAFNLGYSSAAAGRGLICLESRMPSSSSTERTINSLILLYVKEHFDTCVFVPNLMHAVVPHAFTVIT